MLTVFGGTLLQDHLAMSRDQLADIIFGTVFLFVGLSACGIAAMRRRSGVRALIWLGIWSVTYGAARLTQSPAVLAVLTRWLQISAPYANTVMKYLIFVAGSLAFLELTIGKIRFYLWAVVLLALAMALAGWLLRLYRLERQTDSLQPTPRRLLPRCLDNRRCRAKAL